MNNKFEENIRHINNYDNLILNKNIGKIFSFFRIKIKES